MVNQSIEQSEKLKRYDALLLDIAKITKKTLDELKLCYQDGKDAISEGSPLTGVYKKIGRIVKEYLNSLDEMLNSIEPRKQLSKEITRENYFLHKVNNSSDLLLSVIACDRCLVISYMKYYIRLLRLDSDYKNNNE